MNAKSALIGCFSYGINEPCIIGTCNYAVFATDTFLVISQDNAVFSFVCGFHRTNRNTWRLLAMVAQPWQEMVTNIRIFSFFNMLDPRSENG